MLSPFCYRSLGVLILGTSRSRAILSLEAVTARRFTA